MLAAGCGPVAAVCGVGSVQKFCQGRTSRTARNQVLHRTDWTNRKSVAYRAPVACAASRGVVQRHHGPPRLCFFLFLPSTLCTRHMEFDIKAIDFDADVYDVRKALELVLQSPDQYDPNDPRNKGRKPNFEVVLGESPAGRIHNGTGILRVTNFVGNNLHRWIKDSNENKIFVKGRALRLFRTPRPVSPLVKQQLEKAFYVGPEKEKQRVIIDSQARQVCSRIAKVQFGVWYRQPNSPPNHGRAFSIEYERDFLSQSQAYISVVYEHKLVRIEVGITSS